MLFCTFIDMMYMYMYVLICIDTTLVIIFSVPCGLVQLLYFAMNVYMGRNARKSVFGVSDKVRLKLAYSAAETS